MLTVLFLKVLRSARYAYDNTPDSDSRLRAHYLALIIRSRKTFKRSGTMQMEMEMGSVCSSFGAIPAVSNGSSISCCQNLANGGINRGKIFFDLFVAMCNHVDDLVDAK
jgi:hypothetical protein